ncbi:hypothetical protein G5C51_08715, partial [Streptomyces sp. A7024]|nr:hypothetical protein [Streptomyces coryli]
ALRAAGAARGPEANAAIEAEGPPGATLPAELPAGCAAEPSADGAVRITVPEPEVNAALRALLDARPPWRIRSVNPVPPVDPVNPSDPSDPAQGDPR